MNDARQLNVRDGLGRLLCPACGFPGYANTPPYDARGGLIGMTICVCCMWEPGFDDAPTASALAGETVLASLRRYRSAWDDQAHWSRRDIDRPDKWDGAEQLRRLFEVAPHLR